MGVGLDWVTAALILEAGKGTDNRWGASVPTRGAGTGAWTDSASASLGA